MLARDNLKKGICFNLGDGHTIKHWSDLWIPWIEGKVPALKLGQDACDVKKVMDLKSSEYSDWNMEFLENLCDPETCAAIKKVKWP